MNSITLRTALIIGTASLFTLGASATPGSMEKLDLNGDNYVDRTEFLSGANQRFSEMDTDANGVVTKDERQIFRDIRRAERAQRKFDRTDVNGDKMISQQEFDDARAEREQKRAAARAERKERRQMRNGQMAEKQGRQGRRDRFKPDTNNDGVIDVAEHTAAAEHHFERMDKDGDGVLSVEELKRKKRRGHRMQRR